ncbi:MAG: hypothetical protein ACJASB_001119 [Shewanella psychromarinicola]|jgi:hypothetical protein
MLLISALTLNTNTNISASNNINDDALVVENAPAAILWRINDQ